mmetsp:Transcript_4477/g.11409  ORF Transcript_4477/g.11409 Transcript_4477/m.11409 type:complete len:94 (-) Transcript_4477:858-1139(-)
MVHDGLFDRGGFWMASNVAVRNGQLVLRAVPQNSTRRVNGSVQQMFVSGAASPLRDVFLFFFRAGWRSMASTRQAATAKRGCRLHASPGNFTR